MRGDPDYIDRASAEKDRAARDKFAEERESYRDEALAEAELNGFSVGVNTAVGMERRRILTALTSLEQRAASLFFEGTPSQRAVAGYVAEVRKIVEGEGK